MSKKQSKHQTLSQAEARIAALEAELSSVRAGLQDSGFSSALAETEAWLRQMIIRLFDHDNSQALQEALGELGQFLHVDNCLLARVHEPELTLQLCWQRHPDIHKVELLSKLNLNYMPVAHAAMRLGKVRVDCDIHETGYSSDEAKKIARKLDLGAYITVPIFHHGELHSVLALIQDNKPRQWSERDIHVAESFGAVLTLALSRLDSLQALGTSQQRFENAMAATRDGIWEWDLATQKLYFSDGFYYMLGFEPGEFVANYENLERIVHPDEHTWLRNFAKLARTGAKKVSESTSREIRLRHKSGRTIWCFVRSIFTHFDDAGRPTRVVGVNADISKFKAVQEELSIAKTLADSANQAKSEFLTRMSHEIRTPMNAIIGMGHLLADTRLNRVQRDYLGNIDHAANALLSLINEILDFSKIEAGTIVLENNHFDLSDTLNKLAKKTGPLAEQKGLEVIYELKSDVPLFLKGDSLRLRQTLFSLVDNAIKFTAQGEVHVNISVAENHKDYVALRFEVTDTGIGMTQPQMSELFTPFMQIDGSSRRRFGGTGLGLTVCKHLIELMHGTIDVSSTPQSGSQFSFTARFGHSQIGSLPIRDKSQKIRNLRTLVVDDNKAARQILTNLATHLELQVVAVSSAEEAYATLAAADSDKECAFDLVLMDYKMPDIDGLAASDTIKNKLDLKNVPAIILVSAYHRDEVFHDKRKHCVENFISKPISQSHLFDAIAEIFGDSVFQNETDKLQPDQVAETLKDSHILLAEDNIVNQKVAVGILNKMAVRVTVANNGQEALDHLHKNPTDTFAAILMDMEMPEIDGYDATRLIRAGNHCNTIPIIAMTAHAMRGDKERCLQAGMDGYITKPVKPELLYQTLASFIQKHDSKQKTH